MAKESGASLKDRLGNGIHGKEAATFKGGGSIRPCRARGGKVEDAGGNPRVESEAEDKGERELGPIGGAKGKKRMDRKRGGKAKAKGGGAGANPFSGAHSK
jgi:hypothetical protein